MRSRGFTLIELLVAVFVSAIMFALGYAALGQVITQRGRVQAQQQAIDDLQRAMRVMTLDFAQAAPRPVRESLGRDLEPAVLADARTSGGVFITRVLGAPVLAAAGPALQRVEWRLEDGALVRRAWAAADRTQTTAVGSCEAACVNCVSASSPRPVSGSVNGRELLTKTPPLQRGGYAHARWRSPSRMTRSG
jgi:general secretion pathway protein J